MRFSPVQSDFARRLCEHHGMPADASTGVLIDGDGAHRDSTASLRILRDSVGGAPYGLIGRAGLAVPRPVRDAAYRSFARHRGAIWSAVKRLTGTGDTDMEAYRGRILGLDEPLDPSWGFRSRSRSSSSSRSGSSGGSGGDGGRS